jgi:Cytochrome c oxidase subunit Va.
MEDKLITLKNYETMVEAMFDQELLRENNIESSMNNEDSVELMPMFGEINNGLRIMVLEADFERAIKVLEDYKDSIDN